MPECRAFLSVKSRISARQNINSRKKFGQLILTKIIKIVATKCQILRLKCSEFDFGRGSVRCRPLPSENISYQASRNVKESGKLTVDLHGFGLTAKFNHF